MAKAPEAQSQSEAVVPLTVAFGEKATFHTYGDPRRRPALAKARQGRRILVFCLQVFPAFKPWKRRVVGVTENKMKPTNPNADTYVEEQKQYL